MTIDESFRKELVYRTDSVASQIFTDIDALEQFDREYEGKQSLWGWIGTAGILVVVGSVIGLFLSEGNGGLAAACLLGVGVGVISAIVGFVVRASYGKFNLQDMRYLFLKEIVRLLKTDMKEEDTFQVELSFRAHNHKTHFNRTGMSGPWNVKYYIHPWITISGRLMDGSRFTLTLTEKQQDRHKTKRSASGKLKTKYKTKNSGEVTVILRFKERRYPLCCNDPAIAGRRGPTAGSRRAQGSRRHQ